MVEKTAPEPTPEPCVSLVLVRVADGTTGGDAGRSGAALIFEILDLEHDEPPRPAGRPALSEELTSAESRVLRLLPTNLTAREIAGELGVSVNTVKTHMRHIYAKVGTHRRRDAVARAQSVGLLPGTSRNRAHTNGTS